MKHILICDDNTDILEVTSTILCSLGYRVTPLVECTDICNKAERILPDLILMDFWLPEKNGEDAIRELKANSKTKHIPVLLFSVVNDVEKVAERCGADGVIKKPYDITQLEITIQFYLSHTTTSA